MNITFPFKDFKKLQTTENPISLIDIKKGYKIFNPDLIQRDYQYKLNDINTTSTYLYPRHNGLHYCLNAVDCLSYADLETNGVYAEVEAVGDVVNDMDVCVTNALKITKVLTYKEFRRLCSGTFVMKTDEHYYVTIRKRGILYGGYKTFDVNTMKLVAEGNYIRGLLYGKTIIYSNTGIKEIMYDNADPKIDYYPDDKIIYIKHYDLNGNCIYSENRIQHKQQYVKHGLCYDRYANNQIKYFNEYDYGKLKGYSSTYDKQGKPLYVFKCINDVKIELYPHRM